MAAVMRPIKGEPGKFFIPALNKVISIIEWRVDDKYDTVSLPAAAVAAGTIRNFFRDLANKDLVDTNLTTPRRIPAGEQLILKRIGLYIPLATGNDIVPPADIKRVLDAGYLSVRINKKDVSEGPFIKFQPGYGMAGQTVEAGAGVVSNGVPSTAAAQQLEKEQEINEDHDLEAVATFFDRAWLAGLVGLGAAMPTLTEAMLIRLFFHGLVKSAGTKGS